MAAYSLHNTVGNRNDTVADTLNRPITIGGDSCASEMNGNRAQFGSIRYSWDQLIRLHQYNTPTTYTYGADGMRVYKANTSGSTSYRYDGQMGMEDVDYASNGSVNKVTDYGIGSRGIDADYVTQSGTTTSCYPIDAHANMLSTLMRAGGSYSMPNLRIYDAWGIIRVGAQSGEPNGRYCASLGHKEDDESGLIYMSARFYEPSSGRFLNQDPQRNWGNWFVYCHNDPINRSDRPRADDKPAWLTAKRAFFGAVGVDMMAVSLALLYAATTPGEAGTAVTVCIIGMSLSLITANGCDYGLGHTATRP